jgi:metacaspase-1
MYMSSEFEKLKANKIADLKNKYNITVQQLTKKFNTYLSLIKRLRAPLRNKNNAIRILTNNYNNSINSLKNKLNSDINSVEKITITKNSPNNKITALIIGINYNSTLYQLNGCINDAENMQKYCNSSGFKNTVLLTDNTSIKPTKQNIIKEFKKLLNNSDAGDLLVFSFSGHGSYIRDNNGDENDGRDEMIIPIDFQPILDDEFRNIIQTNLKKDVTLFALFDSCHSGTVLDLKYQYYDSSNYDEFTINEKVFETNGDVIMISGCADAQTSMDSYFNNKWQGALTWSFLESLKELESPTWRELIKNMRDILKNKNYEQIPQLSSGRFFDIDTNVFL